MEVGNPRFKIFTKPEMTKYHHSKFENSVAFPKKNQDDKFIQGGDSKKQMEDFFISKHQQLPN